MAEDHRALFAEEFGADDRLRESGLVLEREEHESFRGAGTLTDDDRACRRNAPAGGKSREIGGRDDVVLLELSTEVLDEVLSGRDLHRAVVGHRFFDRGHLRKTSSVLGPRSSVFKQLTGGFGGFRGLPERASPR